MTATVQRDWLESRFARLQRATFGPQGRHARFTRGELFERPIFELLDDHPGEDCEGCQPGETVFVEVGE